MAWVYDFTEGNRDQRNLLGGKGANLAEMTRLGLPVPPGFTITTDACRYYLEKGSVPDGLFDEVARHVKDLEESTGKRLGDPSAPLLVSVRSGSPVSMPGMMDTILDLGLNDETVQGLAEATGDRHFAFDSYRRFIQMFATTAKDVDADGFHDRLAVAREQAAVAHESELSLEDLESVVEDFKRIYSAAVGEPFPADPTVQLRFAVEAVFRSWNSRRAGDYRALNKIPDDLGTAVNVQAMVFGNMGGDSGTGVAFTRDPNSGAPEPLIDFLNNAQGEDVVAGIRKTVDGETFEAAFPEQAAQLRDAMELLERHERDTCDLEFTIEQGTLYLLQVRVAKRTAAAALRIAQDLRREGQLSDEEALMRVSPDQLETLLHPSFDPNEAREVLATGIAASPGAASGIAVFTPDEAEERGRAGERVVLVREMTSPEDLHGMAASQGILTAQGGNLSHAAIVAKSMGLPAVCGADIEIDGSAKTFRSNGRVIHDGDVISIDGSVGEVCAGEVPVIRPDGQEKFGELLALADRRAKLQVRANADLPADCVRARRFGALGVGLCRTEHMFLGDRLPALRRYILATDEAQAGAALDEIRDQQRADFVKIFEAMDGLPVTIRLLDPPLHEFLPSLDDLVLREARGEASEAELAQLPMIRSLQEENPMLGFRGCRLGVEHPDLYNMQVAAIADAAAERASVGGDPRVEIMIPLVAASPELALLREYAQSEWDSRMKVHGANVGLEIGTMIEVPRAALIADRIAVHADFFSFGTNDLTQMTWAFSRDDAEAHFLADYIENEIISFNPFDTLDTRGVGKLIEIATAAGREAKPELSVGVCGEHGGDAASIEAFHALGLDYVSCSPFRVPSARLAAAQAAIKAEAGTTHGD